MDERSYIAANDCEPDRLRGLVEGLDDVALTTPVNEYWTVAGVLGHLAFWDIRVLLLADKIDRGEPFGPEDAEPEGDWLNDATARSTLYAATTGASTSTESRPRLELAERHPPGVLSSV